MGGMGRAHVCHTSSALPTDHEMLQGGPVISPPDMVQDGSKVPSAWQRTCPQVAQAQDHAQPTCTTFTTVLERWLMTHTWGRGGEEAMRQLS